MGVVSPKRLETGFRTNSAGMPSSGFGLLRFQLLGFYSRVEQCNTETPQQRRGLGVILSDEGLRPLNPKP